MRPDSLLATLPAVALAAEHLAVVSNGAAAFYHPDHLGSAMVVFSPFPLRELVPRGAFYCNPG